MKTAMQELIEWYQKEHFVKTTFHIQLLNKFESYLEKEKEQIINFAYEILKTSDEHQSGYVNIEEIYNQTYNQNK
jgi:hypothetical protein